MKNFLGLNWKVRAKHGTFWVGVGSALLLFVKSLCGLCGVPFPLDETALKEVFMALLALLAVLGVITDPTTDGVVDSTRALTYDEPA